MTLHTAEIKVSLVFETEADVERAVADIHAEIRDATDRYRENYSTYIDIKSISTTAKHSGAV